MASNKYRSTKPKMPSAADGIYANEKLMLSTTALVGAIARVICKDGHCYEGVLHTFSPEYELAIHTVVKINPNNVSGGQNLNGLLASLKEKEKVYPEIIFKFEDVVALSVLNVDLEFASKAGQFTDTEISRFDSSSINHHKRELVPWVSSHEDDGLTLEDETATSEKSNQNGWNADEMFKLNEEKYKITSDFDENLSQYTVPLVKQDTDEYRKREAEANRIAQEVENDKISSERTAKEDGDEEQQFSAVIRPVSEPSQVYSNRNQSQSQRRKPQSQMSGPSTVGSRGKGPLNNSPALSSNTHSKYHTHSYSDITKESHKVQHPRISFGSLPECDDYSQNKPTSSTDAPAKPNFHTRTDNSNDKDTIKDSRKSSSPLRISFGSVDYIDEVQPKPIASSVDPPVKSTYHSRTDNSNDNRADKSDSNRSYDNYRRHQQQPFSSVPSSRSHDNRRQQTPQHAQGQHPPYQGHNPGQLQQQQQMHQQVHQGNRDNTSNNPVHHFHRSQHQTNSQHQRIQQGPNLPTHPSGQSVASQTQGQQTMQHSYVMPDKTSISQSQQESHSYHSAAHDNQPSQPQRTTISQRTNVIRKKEDLEGLKKFSAEFKIEEGKKQSSRDNKENLTSKSGYNQEKKDSYDKSDSQQRNSKKAIANENEESKKDEASAIVSSAAPLPSHVTSVPVSASSPAAIVESPKAEIDSETEKIVKKSTLNPNAKEFNPSLKSFTPRSGYSSGQSTPASTPSSVMTPLGNPIIPHNHNHLHSHSQQMHQHVSQARMQSPMVAFQPSTHFMPSIPIPVNQFIMQAPNMTAAQPFQPNSNSQNMRQYKKGSSQQYQNQNNRHEFSQTPATVAAATGHPVLAGSPMQTHYSAQQQAGVMASNATPQQLYPQQIYMGHPRINVISPQSMGVMPHISYDMGQPFYMTHMPLQPHHIVAQVQAQQNLNLSNAAGQLSSASTPQSVTPNTSIQGAGSAPSPVHHPGQVSNNQPPTPTPGQTVIYIPQAGQAPSSMAAHSANAGHYPQTTLVPYIVQQNHHQ